MPMPMHMRVMRPAPGVLAFYDGRVPGYRFSEHPNWVDPFALSLGVCAYAILEGSEAIVFDTHVSIRHARYMRDVLETAGARRFTVILSHWHLDHVAGTEVFADGEVIANERTAAALAAHRGVIEAGTYAGPPAIDPLVPPTRVFADELTLTVGRREVRLLTANVHSDDATLLWLPDERILLAGDTMEDPVMFVDEPQHLDVHLAELARLAALDPAVILPSHGSPDTIAHGGYSADLIAASQQYLRTLKAYRDDPTAASTGLREAIAPSLEAGWVTYFAPYETVHQENLDHIVALGA